jgi:outer membrane beta-barrel protein
MKKAMRGSLALTATLILIGGAARAEEKAAQSAKDQSQIETDIEKFWGKRRKVAVIQKRLFDEKQGRWEISLHFGYIPNDPFVNYVPVGARFAYHFREWIAMEFGGMYTPSFDSSLASGIKGVGTGTPFQLNVTIMERQKWFTHLNAVFSVIHGKVAFLKTGLSHFDLFLTVGPSFHYVDPPVAGDGTTTSASSFRFGGNVGGGMKFFVNDFFGIRLDVRQYFFQKSGEAGGGVHKPTEITLGATFFAG